MSERHYTYRVEWSPEDGEWVGLVAEFPSLSWLAADPVDAVRGIRDVVEGVVADMEETGDLPPEPLAERRYSGKVFVRTSPELHRRLTIEAAEQGVSVNQWAMQKLAEQRGGLLPLLARRCRDEDEAGHYTIVEGDHLRELGLCLMAAASDLLVGDDDAPPRALKAN